MPVPGVFGLYKIKKDAGKTGTLFCFV